MKYHPDTQPYVCSIAYLLIASQHDIVGSMPEEKFKRGLKWPSQSSSSKSLQISSHEQDSSAWAEAAEVFGTPSVDGFTLKVIGVSTMD